MSDNVPGRPSKRSRRRRADGDVLAVIGWFWRDWRASTARAAMSPLARGVYRELLDAHWGERDCSLPDDDRMLAALAGVSAEEWASVKDEVLPWLPLNAKGRRQNPRALAAWKEALAFRKEKREAGKQGAAKRWHSHGRPTAEPLANDGPPPPSHSSASQILNSLPDPERASAPSPDQSPQETGYAATHHGPQVEPTTGRSPRHPAEDAPNAIDPAVAQLVELWNEVTAGSPLACVRIAPKGSGRAVVLRDALRVYPDLKSWRGAFCAVLASPHHIGRNDRGWTASIDFVCRKSERDKWIDAGLRMTSTTVDSGPRCACGGVAQKSDPKQRCAACLTVALQEAST